MESKEIVTKAKEIIKGRYAVTGSIDTYRINTDFIYSIQLVEVITKAQYEELIRFNKEMFIQYVDN